MHLCICRPPVPMRPPPVPASLPHVPSPSVLQPTFSQPPQPPPPLPEPEEIPTTDTGASNQNFLRK